ncbi:ribosomal protein S18-alanine N-acetyltransferase [Psychrobacter lutiphocae]|uniref:ribosomal protein S18-alanine N-acetyltransferase n=1 Tax=Psychrobacter lutiphocae TaxID=540500 RepID=UPI00035F036A|nr:ribosomal protein S18-alanine N-acetyltransferase [Psychrobacter lutiphocae]
MKNNKYLAVVNTSYQTQDSQCIKEIADIECLLQSADSWDAQVIYELLQQDINHCWVVVIDSQQNQQEFNYYKLYSGNLHNKTAQVVAYCLFSTVFEVTEILRIGTHPDYQRQGLAKQLLTQLIAQMPEMQLERILLEVRSDNIPAIALYQNLGFVIIHTRKAYYINPVCDALIMEYQLDTQS